MTAVRSSSEPSLAQAEPERLTGEELARGGNTGRCELIEGRLVPMGPTKPEHGWSESELGGALRDFVRAHDLGAVQVGEVGIYTRRNPDTVRGADVLFISHERLARATPDSFLDVAPELVAEILSPADRRNEVNDKLREYFAIGVRVALVVDPRNRTVSVYRSPTNVSVLTADDRLTVDDILPGFGIPVADLFPSRRQS